MPHPQEVVEKVLEGYAVRGIFKGFGKSKTNAGRPCFKLEWHRNQTFELFVDPDKKRLTIPTVLPQVPARSEMYRAFKTFLDSRHSRDLPEHRRIDASKAVANCTNRLGTVGLTLTVTGGDYEYAARKLIGAVHETFLVFLIDGPYYEYQVETFDLDPDKM